MNLLKKINPVFALYFIIAMLMLLVFPRWHRYDYESVIAFDSLGYYLYLPATFIYHDIFHLAFAPQMLQYYQNSSYFYQAIHLPNDKWVLSYTMGLALLQAPFFFIAHLLAHLFGFKADGFSYPYQFCIMLSGIFYGAIGFYYQQKILQRYVSKAIANQVLLVLLLVTNLGFYCFFENGMTHCYLFFLFSILIWNTIKWHENFQLKHLLVISISLALMVITRPSEALTVLIPALWGINSCATFLEKIKIVVANFKQILLAALMAFPILFLQLWYWKTATNQWFFNSYEYNNLHFNFTDSHVMRGLFSAGKGWLIYSPVLLLSLIGIFFLRTKKLSQSFLPILIFTPINIFIVFSWCIWWYGASYGCRALVQSYALLSIPMAATLDFAAQKRSWKIILQIFIAICLLLNVFKIYQYQTGILPNSGSNNSLIRQRFFQFYLDKKSNDVVGKNGCIADAHIISRTTLSTGNFPNTSNLIYQAKDTLAKVDAQHPYANYLNISLKNSNLKRGDWVRIHFKVMAEKHNPLALCNCKLFFDFDRNENSYDWVCKNLVAEFKNDNDFLVWKEFDFETQVPDFKVSDNLKCYLMMDADGVLYASNYKVELLKVDF